MLLKSQTWLHLFAVCGALTATTLLAFHPKFVRQVADENLFDQRVGQVDGHCCVPGHRWGCAPANFRQTGCTEIDLNKGNFPQCSPMPIVKMHCTEARCERSNPETRCDIRIRNVAKNRCQPTGDITTRGCPVDQWQCQIDLFDYTRSDAPKALTLVCHGESSTTCGSDYSVCD